MNKSFFIIILLSSFLHNSATAMDLIDQQITLTNVLNTVQEPIINLLPKEDVADMRLVCKEWATKDLNWKNKSDWSFMPDDVENEYDRARQNKNAPFLGCSIGFNFILKNNVKAVQWIYHHAISFNYNSLMTPKNLVCDQFKISPYMIALHTKNQEIMRFLIESNNVYEDKNWKSYYKKLTVPSALEKCLNPSNKRDFSFLPYLVAITLDHAHDLKTLYQQKTPTHLGHKIALYMAIEINAVRCFNLLLTSPEIQKIVANPNLKILEMTILHNKKYFAHKIIEHKLYDLTKQDVPLSNQTTGTILDYYLQDDVHTKYPYAHDFLRDLGAQTAAEIEKDAHNNNCLIQ